MKNFAFPQIILIVIFSCFVLVNGCSTSSDKQVDTTIATSESEGIGSAPPSTRFTPYIIQDSSQITEYEEGLKIYVVKEGQGELPQTGQNILINYHGMLMDGSVFDSSFERGSPFSFALGTGQVIRGWDLGIAKLPFGSKAILILPPDIAYGAMARPNIPANSTLIFHVELLGAF